MRNWCSKLWADHSLTLCAIVLGVVGLAWAIHLREGMWFDIVSGIATAFIGVGLYNILAWFLREKVKPED